VDQVVSGPNAMAAPTQPGYSRLFTSLNRMPSVLRVSFQCSQDCGVTQSGYSRLFTSLNRMPPVLRVSFQCSSGLWCDPIYNELLLRYPWTQESLRALRAGKPLSCTKHGFAFPASVLKTTEEELTRAGGQSRDALVTLLLEDASPFLAGTFPNRFTLIASPYYTSIHRESLERFVQSREGYVSGSLMVFRPTYSTNSRFGGSLIPSSAARLVEEASRRRVEDCSRAADGCLQDGLLAARVDKGCFMFAVDGRNNALATANFMKAGGSTNEAYAVTLVLSEYAVRKRCEYNGVYLWRLGKRFASLASCATTGAVADVEWDCGLGDNRKSYATNKEGLLCFVDNRCTRCGRCLCLNPATEKQFLLWKNKTPGQDQNMKKQRTCKSCRTPSMYSRLYWNQFRCVGRVLY
jgi:hypothetical protein